MGLSIKKGLEHFTTLGGKPSKSRAELFQIICGADSGAAATLGQVSTLGAPLCCIFTGPYTGDSWKEVLAWDRSEALS
jgi:hypothetical protein